jgi:hypothetical protein
MLALSDVAPTRRRRSPHDPGGVVRELVVSIVDGGDCLADLAVLREARRQARQRAWANGAATERITLDFDATLVTSHSEKEGAAADPHGPGGGGLI